MLKPIETYIKALKEDNKIIFLNWCKKNSIIKYLDDDRTWIKILPDIRKADKVISAPLCDHACIFQKQDGSRIWIFQPYYCEKDLVDNGIYEWASERGLKVKINKEESWHLPGSTILVQCEVLDEVKCREYIKAHRIGGKNRLTVVE